MLNSLHSLDLSAQEIELIESALHTQQKILTVQSEAGGSGAHKRLTDHKQLIKRISRSRLRKHTGFIQSWVSAVRMMFCTHCNQPR
ncbi:hypothetical protein [Roseobacter sp.]|uniref:hypothetical protein n=1 Tax=Roseobacter sp. TaxID=1907202 RepID=UPI0032984FFD